MNRLTVHNLRTHFFVRSGVVKAVDGVSFHVAESEVFGLVGESGSGKSVLGFSLLGLIEPPGKIVEGRIDLFGTDVRSMSRRELRRMRGSRVSMVFQDPMMTLNPVLRIATQMIETIKAHESVSTAAARKRSLEALEMVGISAPGERLQQYPHELSGGMRQRVAIAIAMLLSPDLIIADEPTTALDVTVQAQILSEMQSLCRQTGASLIWISHDLAVIAEIADRVAVMYAGKLVEQGTVDDVLDRPAHPYTRGLIDSNPQEQARGKPLAMIPGVTPSPWNRPGGCAFRQRCPRADSLCTAEPPRAEARHGHEYLCFHPLLSLK